MDSLSPKHSILSLPFEEFPGESFRKNQIQQWIFEKGAADFSVMSNLPKTLREELEQKFSISAFKLVEPFVSTDGSVKYLFTLPDGMQTEAVYMPYVNRKTICISSMVGCSAGCTFCATGKMGFGRNLTADEIVDQVLQAAVHQVHSPREIRNVVLMGMGEPLLNVDHVFGAIEKMLDPRGLAMSPRRITLSTVGIPRGIRRMTESDLDVRLALSLHAPDDETRKIIIPTAQRYTIAEIMDAVREYYDKTKRRVTLEYTMLAGLNDRTWQAREIAQHVKGLTAHVNLIPWNEWEGAPHQGTSKEGILKFQAELEKAGIEVSVRWSRGRDVGAACGQLALVRSEALTDGEQSTDG